MQYAFGDLCRPALLDLRYRRCKQFANNRISTAYFLIIGKSSQCPAQGKLQPTSDVFLHPRHCMRVYVESYAHRAMTKTFRDLFGLTPSLSSWEA